MSGPYQREFEVAARAAVVAGQKALAYFQKPLHIRYKADRTFVTDADLASEQAFLEIIGMVFPNDSTLAEESGEITRGSGRKWILDPLDGTKGFTRGLPFWSVLAALEENGEIVAGVAHFPALNLTYSASRGAGCFKNEERIHCSDAGRLEEAVIQVSELSKLLASEHASAIEEIIRRSLVTRSIGDALAGCLVVEGSCDAWMEDGLQPWDAAPFFVLAPEAGARVTDWTGAPSFLSGSIVLAPPTLHGHCLSLLK